MTTRPNNFEEKEKQIRLFYDGIAVIVYALAFVVLIFTFVFLRVTVDGKSMNKTLDNEDRLIACNINYTPKDGDVVIVQVPNNKNPIVKRVIATGGQTIDIDYASHRVTVDNEILSEPYIKEPTAFMGEIPVELPLTVPKNFVFLMGDNRNDSIDSRSSEIGLVSRNQILGKAIIKYYPYKEMKFIK